MLADNVIHKAMLWPKNYFQTIVIICKEICSTVCWSSVDTVGTYLTLNCYQGVME